MKNEQYAPVLLFVYNRPIHTKRTVEALLANDLASSSDLIVYADGPQKHAIEVQIAKIQETREYISTVSGFRSVELHFAENNIGCADSIIRGITDVINRYGRVIVVEDDIVTHPFFLRFMNEALFFYETDKRIFTIGGNSIKIDLPADYSYDVYLSPRSVSSGWATWKDRWDKADWAIEKYPIILHPYPWRVKRFNRGGEDLYRMLVHQLEGKIDAWDIRWEYTMCRNGGYTIIPTRSFDVNIGFDGSGTHSGESPIAFAPMYSKTTYDIKLIKNIRSNKRILKSYHDFFGFGEPKVSFCKHLKRMIKKLLGCQ